MRNFLFGACFALLIVFVFKYCDYRRLSSQEQLQSTALLEQQIKNVGKLVVTEGAITQIHNYQDTKSKYFEAFTSTKKALIVVDAKAQVSYDLKKMEVVIDTAAQKVMIRFIPKPELTIIPRIEYYDVENGLFNDFDAEALNAITAKVTDSLRVQAMQSELMTNAQNRLITELQQIYLLTNAMGWTLEYQEKTINDQKDWKLLEQPQYD